MYGASVLTARMAAWLSAVGDRPVVADMPAVDDGVHPADGVHLGGDASGFNGTTKITDDQAGGPWRNIVECGGPLARPRVQNDVMALVDERPRGGTPQAVCAASDENASHRTPCIPPRICLSVPRSYCALWISCAPLDI
jgi:hypothetical protein